jgi:hypothetical protein
MRRRQRGWARPRGSARAVARSGPVAWPGPVTRHDRITRRGPCHSARLAARRDSCRSARLGSARRGSARRLGAAARRGSAAWCRPGARRALSTTRRPRGDRVSRTCSLCAPYVEHDGARRHRVRHFAHFPSTMSHAAAPYSPISTLCSGADHPTPFRLASDEERAEPRERLCPYMTAGLFFSVRGLGTTMEGSPGASSQCMCSVYAKLRPPRKPRALSGEGCGPPESGRAEREQGQVEAVRGRLPIRSATRRAMEV